MGVMKKPIVVVSWYDAGAGATVEEAKSYHRKSVGYLVEDSEDGVVITMEPDELSGVHFVPRGMVTGMVVVNK